MENNFFFLFTSWQAEREEVPAPVISPTPNSCILPCYSLSGTKTTCIVVIELETGTNVKNKLISLKKKLYLNADQFPYLVLYMVTQRFSQEQLQESVGVN